MTLTCPQAVQLSCCWKVLRESTAGLGSTSVKGGAVGVGKLKLAELLIEVTVGANTAALAPVKGVGGAEGIGK